MAEKSNILIDKHDDDTELKGNLKGCMDLRSRMRYLKKSSFISNQVDDDIKNRKIFKKLNGCNDLRITDGILLKKRVVSLTI